jgi:DNA-binding transcriptional ArsR family regulator
LAIRFRVEDRPESVRFALAPAAEAVMSLHVLLFPKIHAVQHPWIRAMRAVSPALKREIRAFAFLYADAYPDCFTPTRSHMTFEDQLEVIRRLDDAQAAHEFARPLFFYWEPSAGGSERLGDPAVRDGALAFARETAGDAGAELAAAAFDDPGRLRDRLVALLERYWEEAFAAEWARVEPRLRDAAAAGAGRAIAEGPLALLGDVPDLRLEGDTVIRRSGHEHLVDVSPANPLLLVPSAYVWPHVRVNCDPPWPIIVIYAGPFVMREAARDELAAALVQTLRAVGDETRLRILKLVAERPRPTEELAPLVSLSEPALSRQLRILSEAGLVRPQRNGYYVLYGLEREALETLPATLSAFLGQSQQ